MEAAEIFRQLSAAGIRLELQGDQLSASPASRLTDNLRAVVRAHKPALIAYLAEAHVTTAELLTAAARACDRWGDSPEARAQMRQDIEATPPQLRADLLEHLQATYPKEKK